MVQILLLPQATPLTKLHHYLVPHRRYTVMEAHNDYEGDLGSWVAGRPMARPVRRYVIALCADQQGLSALESMPIWLCPSAGERHH